MYNRNEFGAIPNNKSSKNKFSLHQRKRSNSIGGYQSSRQDSDGFSQVSDIPTRGDKSNFLNPRGSNMGTLELLLGATDRKQTPKQVQYRPQSEAKFAGGSYSSEDKTVQEKPKQDSSFASLVISEIARSEAGSRAGDSIDYDRGDMGSPVRTFSPVAREVGQYRPQNKAITPFKDQRKLSGRIEVTKKKIQRQQDPWAAPPTTQIPYQALTEKKQMRPQQAYYPPTKPFNEFYTEPIYRAPRPQTQVSTPSTVQNQRPVFPWQQRNKISQQPQNRSDYWTQKSQFNPKQNQVSNDFQMKDSYFNQKQKKKVKDMQNNYPYPDGTYQDDFDQYDNSMVSPNRGRQTITQGQMGQTQQNRAFSPTVKAQVSQYNAQSTIPATQRQQTIQAQSITQRSAPVMAPQQQRVAQQSAPVRQVAQQQAQAQVRQQVPQQAAPVRQVLQQQAQIQARAPVQAQAQYQAPVQAQQVVRQAAPVQAQQVVRQAAPVQQQQVVRQAAPVQQQQVARQAPPVVQQQPVYQAPVVQQPAPVYQAPVYQAPPQVYETEVYEEPVQYVEDYEAPVVEEYVQPAPVYQAPPVQYVAPQPAPVQYAAPVQAAPVYYAPQPEPAYYEEEEAYEEYQPHYAQPVEQYEEVYYEEDIEPTETDIDDEADLDEGTVIGARSQDFYEPPKPQYSYKPKASTYAPPKKVVDTSPVMKVQRAPVQKERDWQEEYQVKKEEVSRDEWKQIQKKIDNEYEKKLKQVSDDAMQKLQAFQNEHKQLLEKTQYLLDNSQIRSRSGSRGNDSMSDKNSFFTQQVKGDRNRFFSPNIKESGSERFESKTDAGLIRQFHQEYQDALVMSKNLAGESYLVDIIERLNFLYADVSLKEKNRQLYAFLEKSKQNLLVKSDLEKFTNDQDDIVKNLFKICCAILNMSVQQRGSNFLDDKLLQTYLDGINYHRDDPELVLIDQLATIKSLINRKSYSLSDKQIKMIHDKFRNMFDNRERAQYLQERQAFSANKQAEERRFDPKNSAKGPALTRQQTEKKPVYYKPEPARPKAMTAVKQNRSISAKRFTQPQQAPVQVPVQRQVVQRPVQQQPVYAPQPVPVQRVVQQAPVQVQQNPFAQPAYVEQQVAQQPQTPFYPAAQQQQVQQAPPRRYAPQAQVQQEQLRSIQQPVSRSPVGKRGSIAAPEQMIERNVGNRNQASKASMKAQQNDAAYSFGKNNKPVAKANKSYQGQPGGSANRNRSSNRPQVEQSPKARKFNDFKKRQEEEEPICVLKVELDGGENIQHIKVYEGQLPEEIVDEFGRKFNLSERAKFRLLEQINEQINA